MYKHGEIAEVVIFFPNRGGAVVEHCRKYTAGYGAWRGSHPERRPWPCGDRAGVLASPAGGVVVAVGGTVLQAWRRPEGPAGQGLVLVKVGAASEGRAHAVRGFLWRGKYEGGMGSWQHSGWSSAEHVLYCVAGSHSAATTSGMAEQ